MNIASRITAKGQVTIPVAVRRALGLGTGDEVIFELDQESGTATAHVRKAADFQALAGTVGLPPEWADAPWPKLRDAAWSAQTGRRRDPTG